MDDLNGWVANRAKELRKEQTPQEVKLWKALRDRQLFNVKFRRQVRVERYIVDFICYEHRLIIELDGAQHLQTKEYDANRDAWLQEQNFKIIRFWNSQIDFEFEKVLNVIVNHLIVDSLTPGRSPARGEGRSLSLVSKKNF